LRLVGLLLDGDVGGGAGDGLGDLGFWGWGKGRAAGRIYSGAVKL
jgi:hypothetical protein